MTRYSSWNGKTKNPLLVNKGKVKQVDRKTFSQNFKSNKSLLLTSREVYTTSKVRFSTFSYKKKIDY